MPILVDFLEHKVLGREYQRGLLLGKPAILRMQIARRFGPLPDLGEQHLWNMTVDELNALVYRICDAHSLHEPLHSRAAGAQANILGISRSRLAGWAGLNPLAHQPAS
jgi:hypothetical protein